MTAADKPRTLQDLGKGSDDSSDDDDFVPTEPKATGRSKRTAPESGREDEKRVKLDPEEEEKRKKAAAASWKSFLDGGDKAKGESEGGLTGGNSKDKEEDVEIRRPRNFAGEIIYETVTLPRSHPDVQKYGTSSSINGIPSDPTSSSDINKYRAPLPTASTSATATPALPTRRSGPPMRRKPRQSLEAMNASIQAGVKKISTIEKSALDWKSHTASSDAQTQAELEANRRSGSGSFLEKQDLLGRLGDRREQNLESVQKSGRKRV